MNSWTLLLLRNQTTLLNFSSHSTRKLSHTSSFSQKYPEPPQSSSFSPNALVFHFSEKIELVSKELLQDLPTTSFQLSAIMSKFYSFSLFHMDKL